MSEFSGARTPFWAILLTLPLVQETDVAVRLPRPFRTDPYGVANEATAASLSPLVLVGALTQMAAASG